MFDNIILYFLIPDTGLVVPSVSPSLRGLMNETMEKFGIGIERRSESIGRAVAEMALHLLGGPHRMTPKNSHQKPVVVVLCGNHPEGAGAVCAARHLATLGVQTIIYFQSSILAPYILKEVELYKLTGQIIVNSEKSNILGSELKKKTDYNNKLKISRLLFVVVVNFF